MTEQLPSSQTGISSSEAARLAALLDYVDVEATPPPELQAAVRLAARVTGMSNAVVNIIDEHLQRQLATEGFDRADCAREDSMCNVSIQAGGALLHTPDARVDVRFAANPWVDGRLDRIRSYAAAPLTTPTGHILGTLCVFDPEPRRLTAGQQGDLTNLAALVVALFDRERRARREEESAAEMRQAKHARETARALQEALLPHRLPTSPSVTLTGRYLPGTTDADVGGDFFDAVRTDRAIVVAIGDVQGHNAQAAAQMGQVRTALNAYITEGHPPAAALARTNALLVDLRAELFATCCLLSLEERTGEVSIASAGHPAPIVFTADGARALEVDPGPPLGVLPGATYTTARHRLTDSSRMLLYTDGVVEWSRAEPSHGVAALTVALRENATATAEQVADRVLEPVARAQSDDAALLVLDYAGPDPDARQRSLQLATDTAAVSTARRHLRGALREWRLEKLTDAAELLVSEMVTNALVHTGACTALTLRHEAGNDRFTIGVEDSSTRHPQPRPCGEEALGGRGMHIVDTVAQRWWVAPRGDGKTVWAELAC